MSASKTKIEFSFCRSLLFLPHAMKRSFAKTRNSASRVKEPDAKNKRQCSPELADAVFSCPELVRHILMLTGDARSFKALAATNITCRAVAATPSVQLGAKDAYSLIYESGGIVAHRLPYGRYHGQYSRTKPTNPRGDVDWTIKTGVYVDGKRTGVWTCRHQNGTIIRSTPFLDGRRHGTKRVWYSSGELRRERNYNCGVLHGRDVMFYRSGNMCAEGTYCNGKNHGLHTTWYESGMKQREITFVNDCREGLTIEWYDHGGKRSQTNWSKDRRDGICAEWHENGLFEKFSVYQNDHRMLCVRMDSSPRLIEGFPLDLAEGFEKLYAYMILLYQNQ